MIKAKILKDSFIDDERVITIVTQAPKYLDAEIEKHRNLSSNSSSSRAIGFPITKNQITPYMPVVVSAPATTMHNTKECTLEAYMAYMEAIDHLHSHAIKTLSPMTDSIHKQHLNRHVESYTMQTKVITGNYFAWKNFIKLRTSKYADPNIIELTRRIDKCIHHRGNVLHRKAHIPLVSDSELKALGLKKALLCSAGRVAKCSYDNMGVAESVDKAILRATKNLIPNNHKSPFEHQILSELAINNKYRLGSNYYTHIEVCAKYKWSGAIRGAIQFRKLIWKGLDEVDNPVYKYQDLFIK